MIDDDARWSMMDNWVVHDGLYNMDDGWCMLDNTWNMIDDGW